MVGEKPKLAFVTPGPPLESGVVDYGSELIGPLSALADVRLYLDDDAIRAGAWPGRHHLHLPADLRRDHRLLPVYEIANHRSCHFMVPLAFRFPGVVVLHDLNLHRMLADFFLRRGLEAAYFDELLYSHGKDGVRAGRVINSGFYSGALYTRYPLFRGLVQRSRAVIVHSEIAAMAIQKVCPAVPVRKVALHSGFSHLEGVVPTQAAARRELDLPLNAFIVGTAGNLTPSRRLVSCLRAFARHRETHPESIYLVVGRDACDVSSLIEELHLEESVRRMGIVSLKEFHGAVAACDLLCNLRYPTMGETSGSLIRILGVGRPALVSRCGTAMEFPASICPRIDLDHGEVPQLEKAFNRFSRDREQLRRMGAQAKELVAKRHGVDLAARAYVETAKNAHRHSPERPLPNWCRPAEELLCLVRATVQAAPFAVAEKTVEKELSKLLGW